MINTLKQKYPNIKARIKALPQNTFAQEVGKDLLLAFGKPVAKILENAINNAVFESTPVDINTEMEIKKIQLQTRLTDAKTSLIISEKEYLEMQKMKKKLLQEQKEKEEKEALEKAKKLVADAESHKNKNTIYHTVSSQMSDFIEAQEE